jgi:hypothetical protein
MNRSIKTFGVAVALAATATGPALAQSIVKGPPVVYDQRNDPAYQEQQKNYQASRETYLIQRERHQEDTEEYRRAMAAYDAQYGPGAYDRYRTDWYRPYADSPCERASRANQTTGGVIGALAGAALGSNIASGGGRTGGAVLGALAGGALGANIGKSTARCDARGYYYSYDQTVPYREAYDEPPRGRWVRDRCRLAAAPAYYQGATDYRYVRVCPDGSGRYRFRG